jgi:hypothetical protein
MEDEMNPETMRLIVQDHQNALLDEARGERLAAMARCRRRREAAVNGSGRALRSAAGSALVAFGLWLSGSQIETAVNRRG